jgi:hypothetical protein
MLYQLIHTLQRRVIIWQILVFHYLLQKLPRKASWDLARLSGIDVEKIVTDYSRKTVCRTYVSDWESWTDRSEVLLHLIDHVRRKGDYHIPQGLEPLFESEIIRNFNFLEPMQPPLESIDDMKLRTISKVSGVSN